MAAYAWEADDVAKQVQDILDALEAPPINEATRRRLQRILYLREYFGRDRGHVVLVLRCILESTGNEGALIEPVVSAVSGALKPAWENLGLDLVAAFDQIPLLAIMQSMRELDLFAEDSLGRYLGMIIYNKLLKILGPPEQVKPAKPVVKVKPAKVPKPPRAITRIPETEKKIAMGVAMLELRSTTDCNKKFGRLRAHRFDVEAKEASKMMRVAAAYAGKPAIFRKTSWRVLCELTAPSLPPHVRRALEARIVKGEKVGAADIRRVRGPAKRGAPCRRRQERSTARMAA